MRVAGLVPAFALRLIEFRSIIRATKHHEQTSKGEKMHILFVDDEEILVEMNVERFLRMGYDVTACSSSLEALQIFKASSHEFDLVITDYTMPSMTGLELAKKLIAIRSDIPIIMLSGFDETIDRDEIEEAGIGAYAPKTLCRQEIADLIKRELERCHLNSTPHGQERIRGGEPPKRSLNLVLDEVHKAELPEDLDLAS